MRNLPGVALCEECHDPADLHAPGRCLVDGCSCGGFVFQGVIVVDTMAGETVVGRVGLDRPEYAPRPRFVERVRRLLGGRP